MPSPKYSYIWPHWQTPVPVGNGQAIEAVVLTVPLASTRCAVRSRHSKPLGIRSKSELMERSVGHRRTEPTHPADILVCQGSICSLDDGASEVWSSLRCSGLPRWQQPDKPGQAVVKASLPRPLRVALLAPARDHTHHQFVPARLCADAPRHFVAVEAREPDAEQQDLGVKECQCLGSVMGRRSA
jgi:hypothetical protein